MGIFEQTSKTARLCSTAPAPYMGAVCGFHQKMDGSIPTTSSVWSLNPHDLIIILPTKCLHFSLNAWSAIVITERYHHSFTTHQYLSRKLKTLLGVMNAMTFTLLLPIKIQQFLDKINSSNGMLARRQWRCSFDSNVLVPFVHGRVTALTFDYFKVAVSARLTRRHVRLLYSRCHIWFSL